MKHPGAGRVSRHGIKLFVLTFIISLALCAVTAWAMWSIAEFMREPVFVQSTVETAAAPPPEAEKPAEEPEEAAEPEPLPPPVYTARVTFVGDLMVHQDQASAAYDHDTDSYDFQYSLSRVKPYLGRADLAVGNLETTFAGSGFSDFPTFCAPDSFGQALKDAGFDLVSTANNHCIDKREDGLLRTLDVLDELGLSHVGTYRSPTERDEILIKDVNGIKMAFLSYTYGTNGIPLPSGKDYLVNIMSEELLRADIARAKALGPDVVVVLPHMGNEYELYPKDVFKNWISIMLEAGADVVIASHPHVIQPVEFTMAANEPGDAREYFVAYSVGNFISSQRTQPREAGLMLNLTFEKEGDGKAFIKEATYTPTWVKFTDSAGKRDIIVLPVPEVIAAHEAGEDTGLRPKDLNRVFAVQKEISASLTGGDVPEGVEGTEYYLFKRQNTDTTEE